MPRFSSIAKCGAAGAISMLLALTGISTASASASPKAGTGYGANDPGAILTSLDRTSLCHHKKECAVSDDGMVFQITAARRLTDIFGNSIVGIGFTIVNTSKQGHNFSPANGGFDAVLVGGGVTDSTDMEAGGIPTCWDSATIDPNGTDPGTYFVRRGETFRMPKQMCFYPTPGVKVKSVQLSDEDAENPVTINLKSPI
jgi:hypothetical protein